MTNTEALERKIQESGLRKAYVAKQLGLSRQGLYQKINNITEFKASEITTLSNLLDIKDLDEIFFVEKSD